MTDDLIQRLQAAHEDDALEIGLAWNLLGEAADALSSKDAEIAELRDRFGEELRRANKAYVHELNRAERTEARIASAPVVIYGRDCIYASESGYMHEAHIGKRVALVLLDDAQDKSREPFTVSLGVYVAKDAK